MKHGEGTNFYDVCLKISYNRFVRVLFSLSVLGIDPLKSLKKIVMTISYMLMVKIMMKLNLFFDLKNHIHTFHKN